ncbi:MAG: alpha/beta hydrolase [Deltaproteobacteria bacterium]|nr:alpha/beta hydrolase [Deltaproteobacteria bacterium]
MNDIKHHTVQINGISFHVAEKGEGPLALMLHGFPECWYSWRFQIDALAAAGFRAVAPDLRGYGQTDAPPTGYDLRTLVADVRALAAELGEERPHIIGHDWGGLIAWSYAQSHPDALATLTVMDAPHPRAIASPKGLLNPRQLARSWYIFWFQVPYFPERKIVRHARGYAKAAIRGTATRKENFTDADMAVYAELLSANVSQKLAYYRQLFRQFPTVARDARRPITAPTLVLWGENDPFVGAHFTRGLDALGVCNLRGAHVIPNAAHWLQQEAPDEVNGYLVEHLTRRC